MIHHDFDALEHSQWFTYRFCDKRAAQGHHHPHTQPANHDELPVVAVAKVPKDWSQNNETADENCKRINNLSVFTDCNIMRQVSTSHRNNPKYWWR